MPERIQLRRSKDWRKPEGAVSVARPTKWGNPFKRLGENEYLYCDASHRRTVFTPWVIFDHEQDIDREPVTAQMCVDYFRRWLTGEFNAENIVRPCEFTMEQIRAALGGKDLCCWCPEGDPCHADVLLEVANGS